MPKRYTRNQIRRPAKAPDCFFGVEGDDVFQGFQGVHVSVIRANLKVFIREKMGNFIALRAYLVTRARTAVDFRSAHSVDDLKLLKRDNRIELRRNDPAMEILAGLARQGVYSMSLYSVFTPEAARVLQQELGGYFLFPAAGELAGGIPRGPQAGKESAPRDFAAMDAQCVQNLAAVAAQYRDRGFKDVGHVDPPLFHARGLRAGINIPISESMCGFLQLQMAGIRGDARGLGDGRFGSWPAIGYFGGANADPLKPLRLRVALLSSFIAGAKYIISESGHFGTFEFGNSFPAPNLVCNNLRREIAGVYAFIKERVRGNGPLAPFAFVKGRFDGWSGCMGRAVFDQESAGGMWLHSSAERGWDMLAAVLKGYRRCDDYPLQDEETSWFCGTPYGQFDIVPAESRPQALARYGALIFPGWNTMNAELYRKLKKYVSGGGTLFMAVPQLAIDAARPAHVCSAPGMKLFNNGKWEDLFGARITGMGSYFERISHVDFQRDFYGIPAGKRYLMETALHPARARLAGAEVLAVTHLGHPLLVRRRLGKGQAFLLLTWDYPGLNAYRVLMRDCVEALVKNAQPRYRVEGSARVEMAVYRQGDLETIYLLNCDLERSADLSVTAGSLVAAVSLPPAAIRTLYVCGDTAVLFDNETTLAKGAGRRGSGAVFRVQGQDPAQGWIFTAAGRELRALALNAERLDETCFGFRRARFAFSAGSGELRIQTQPGGRSLKPRPVAMQN